MQATALHIHNFRSLKDVEIGLWPFSMLVGANNSGKSNVVDAIRVFYDQLKFDHQRDFPKFRTEDKNTWVEIEFQLSEDEWSALSEKYRSSQGRKIRIRKYVLSEDKSRKPGLYFVREGDSGYEVADDLFYGAKNVQKAKLGKIIYIPAVSKLDEQTKLTGPSPFRDLLSMVLDRVLNESPSYSKLEEAFGEFEALVKEEKSRDGYSLKQLESEITRAIKNWGMEFHIGISPVAPGDILKNLIKYEVEDGVLGKGMDPKLYGQGFQRHLIFTLIKLAAEAGTVDVEDSRRTFSGKLTWLLYEEPEAFLHPTQITLLNKSLRSLAEENGNQVLISTHNPMFVSRNISMLPSLIRLKRDEGYTKVYQIKEGDLKQILTSNIQMLEEWDLPFEDEDRKVEMESLKYALWLDSRRCNAFFGDKVLLVEGPSEVALIEYLIEEGKVATAGEQVVVLDSMGKFNMHRFMNLFGHLGVRHCVLYDRDLTGEGKPKYPQVDNTINAAKNAFTMGIDTVPKDLENFLGIPPAQRPHRKPQHLMYYLHEGLVGEENLGKFVRKIETLLNGGLAVSAQLGEEPA